MQEKPPESMPPGGCLSPIQSPSPSPSLWLPTGSWPFLPRNPNRAVCIASPALAPNALTPHQPGANASSSRSPAPSPARWASFCECSPGTLATEVPAAVGRLEISVIWIEIGAVQIPAIAVPRWAPWRRAVGCGSVGRWRSVGRWWWRGHDHCRWCKCTTDDGADAEAKQASAYRIAMTSSIGRCSEGDERNRGGSRKRFACVHWCFPPVS
jgi:hypothetical protein